MSDMVIDRNTLKAIKTHVRGLIDRADFPGEIAIWIEAYYDLYRACDLLDAMMAREECDKKDYNKVIAHKYVVKEINKEEIIDILKVKEINKILSSGFIVMHDGNLEDFANPKGVMEIGDEIEVKIVTQG